MSSNISLTVGIWYNQLGSSMNLTVNETGLSQEFTYLPSVLIQRTPTCSRGALTQMPPTNTGVTVGRTVTFGNNLLNAHPTSTWSGQFFSDGQDCILTHWLLFTSTSSTNAWDSTNIGTDIITGDKPDAQEIAVGSPPHRSWDSLRLAQRIFLQDITSSGLKSELCSY